MNRHDKSTIMYFLLFAVLPFLFGTAYYYLFCPDVFFVQIIDNTANAILHCTFQRPEHTGLVWKLLRNHLADFLWAQSVTAAVLFVSITFQRNIRLDFSLCIIVALLMEFSQLSEFIHLTFDWLDALVQLMGAIAAFMFLHVFIKTRR